MRPASIGRHQWQVTLPSWRLDLEREIDLIEEVARVYGYNRFANTLPAFGEGVRALPLAEAESTIRRSLLAAGFNEAIGSTFCSAADAALTAPQPGLVVPLGNPLSEEAGVLRPSLVPGMLTMISGNLNRDVNDVRLFELGTVFSGTTEKVEERPSLAFGATGTVPEESALHPARPIEFYDVKGAVEQVLARFHRAPFISTVSRPRRASRRIGCILIVPRAWWLTASLRAGSASFIRAKPRRAKSRTSCSSASCISIGSTGCRCASPRPAISRASSPFAAIFRWFLDKNIGWEKIDQAVAALNIPELVEWRAREVFHDIKLGPREYSLLLGVTFQAPDRTLREEELQDFHTRVIDAVGKAGARLRT